MLTKSMSRLKISPGFIQITQNILTNYSCHVIIPYGPTIHVPEIKNRNPETNFRPELQITFSKAIFSETSDLI